MLSTSKSKNVDGWFSDLFFIIIALIFFYSLWTGSYPLFTPDEGRYSEIAREMVVTGDYITPRLNGIAFLDKPVFYYWLQALAIHLFGLKEWSLRFWPACIGILGSIIVYIAGRKLYDRRTGIISAILLATTPLYFGAAHYANLDLEVAVFISNALLFFISATKTDNKPAKTTYMVLAYTFAACAALTKGLIGIAFPIMIIGAWILILNRWSILSQMRLILGFIIFTAMVTPWYILVQKANPQFFNYFFVLQQFSRFLTKASFNNQSAPWFYVPIVIGGFLPWSFFIFQAFLQHIKCIWQDKQKYSSELFLILWAIIVFTFFSIPKSKTMGYILPIFPALSLIVGNYIGKYWNNLNTISIKIGIVLFIALCLTVAILSLSEPTAHLLNLEPKFIPYLLIAGIMLSIAAISTYILFRFKQFKAIFFNMTLTISLFLLCVIHAGPAINGKSIKPLAQLINTMIKPNDEVATYYRYYQDLPIYLQRRITVVANWHSTDIAQYDNWQRELWYHKNYVDSSGWLIEASELTKRWTENKRMFLLIGKDLYPLFTQELREHTHGRVPVFFLSSFNYNNKEILFLISNKAN